VIATTAVVLFAAASAAEDWKHRMTLTCADTLSTPWVSIDPPHNAKQLLSDSILADKEPSSVEWYQDGATVAACVRRPPGASVRCNSISVVSVTGQGHERVMFEEPWVFCPQAPRP
jgi:hypothetical protein